MNNVNVTSSGGIGFCGALALIFITLKLLDKIDWSWIWILSPLWIPLLIVIMIVMVILLIVGIALLIDG